MSPRKMSGTGEHSGRLYNGKTLMRVASRGNHYKGCTLMGAPADKKGGGVAPYPSAPEGERL